jgi:protein SPA2
VTSQLFLQAPKLEDQLPLSAEGGLPDIHVTAFLSAIDSLLTAARSSSPTRVLTPMKAVVNAVSAIVEDIRSYEGCAHPDRLDLDVDALHTLRERAEATLGNLVAASRSHATSSGMSPVSLLDAAASHVAATITEAGRTLCIRKATKAEQEQFAAPSAVGYLSAVATNGFVPALRTVEEGRSLHTREGSTSSTKRDDAATSNFQASPHSRGLSDPRRLRSDSDASSTPPIFDLPPLNFAEGASDDSVAADGPEDAWAELKVRHSHWLTCSLTRTMTAIPRSAN